MRNPARKRNVAAMCVVAFSAAALVVLQFRTAGSVHGWPDVVAVFASSFALLATIAIPIYQLEVSRYNRLRRGVDVIARWFVSPGDWKQFMFDEEARNSPSTAIRNIIDLKPPLTSEGLEVVVGRNSLMVGGDFHSLPRAGISRISGPSWVEGFPRSLEFAISAPGSSDMTSEWTLRFPVASHAQTAANEVREYYLARTPEMHVERDPKRMQRIGVAIAIAGGASLLAGVAMWNSQVNAAVLLVLVIGGILVTPAGVLVAVVWRRRTPRAYRKYPY